MTSRSNAIKVNQRRAFPQLEAAVWACQDLNLASVARSLGLTRRETEVLVLLAEGRTNRQIGQELFVTEKTASVHVSRILAKLGVAGRGEQPRSPTDSA